jgi:23S rRNA pseudouridine1911/1915/1917 synthase
MGIDILLEDNQVVVIDKPAGMLVQPDRTGDPTVVDLVAAELRRREGKAGNVFLAAAHRLDRPVSGVLLLARTSKSAARLAAQFRDSRVDKSYLALTERVPDPSEATLEHLLIKDGSTNHVRLARAGEAQAKLARLQYRVRARVRGGALVEVSLETGRSHQIRVQLAAIGCPVVGDLRYGASEGLGPRIALHASRLAFDHPTRGERIVVSAPLPAAWGDVPSA